MRYLSLRAFRKHLASAAPDHLCRCYLAAIPDDYERGAAIRDVLSYFPGRPRMSFNGTEAACRDLSEALSSPSLFGGDPVVVLDEAEKMGKKELAALAELAMAPLYGYLVCGARTKGVLGAAFEKAGVVFDLSEEKPWEKEKRLAEQIADQAQSLGKRLASDAGPLLFERIGPDPALLDSEIEKLACFVGTRPTIERSDVFRVSALSRASALWQIAEGIVWEGEIPPPGDSPFHGLVPALRSQLQIGLKISELSASGTPRSEWSGHLPKVWPKLLDKRIGQVAKLGSRYFQHGLDLLFQIEILSRTGSSSEEALLDLFRMSLYHARLGFVNFDSARQGQIEAKRSDRRGPAPSGQSEEEDRFGEVTASQNSQNLTARGIHHAR